MFDRCYNAVLIYEHLGVIRCSMMKFDKRHLGNTCAEPDIFISDRNQRGVVIYLFSSECSTIRVHTLV
jgi:hypothetical protein